MTKKKPIKFICEKCGHENPPIKEKSNENWSVINPKCDECGGKLTLVF